MSEAPQLVSSRHTNVKYLIVSMLLVLLPALGMSKLREQLMWNDRLPTPGIPNSQWVAPWLYSQADGGLLTNVLDLAKRNAAVAGELLFHQPQGLQHCYMRPAGAAMGKTKFSVETVPWTRRFRARQ
jgi:hypothetical protein